MNICEHDSLEPENEKEYYSIIPKSVFYSMRQLCQDASANADQHLHSTDPKTLLPGLEHEEFVLVDASDLIKANEKMTSDELVGLIIREFEQAEVHSFRSTSSRKLVKTLFKTTIDTELYPRLIQTAIHLIAAVRRGLFPERRARAPDH
jgi:hypothetical protein